MTKYFLYDFISLSYYWGGFLAHSSLQSCFNKLNFENFIRCSPKAPSQHFSQVAQNFDWATGTGTVVVVKEVYGKTASCLNIWGHID